MTANTKMGVPFSMKERPILFSAPMVRAILDGTKTQTRRVAKLNDSGRVKLAGSSRNWHCEDPDAWHACPYGVPGDRLWVRETFAWFGCERLQCEVLYRADGHTKLYDGYGGWRPSIHMPRWASRITLEITGVRVEQLQDISEADARAEGADFLEVGGEDGISMSDWSHREGFIKLWESLHGPGSWDANPWTWVVEFKRVLDGRTRDEVTA